MLIHNYVLSNQSETLKGAPPKKIGEGEGQFGCSYQDRHKMPVCKTEDPSSKAQKVGRRL